MEVAAPDFAALWKPMDSGLRRLLRDMRGGSVHEGTLTREQWMQMYTDVYNICVNHDQDLPEQLYENCRGVIHGYLDELKQVRRCAHYTARARCRPARPLPPRAARARCPCAPRGSARPTPPPTDRGFAAGNRAARRGTAGAAVQGGLRVGGGRHALHPEDLRIHGAPPLRPYLCFPRTRLASR